MAVLRRRTNASSASITKKQRTNEEYEEAEFLDEDEQDQLVQVLAEQAIQQTELFRRGYQGIGVFAMLISLAYPFLCEEECSSQQLVCWSHSIWAVFIHAMTLVGTSGGDLLPETTTTITNSGISSKLSIVAGTSTFLTFLAWFSGALGTDMDHFHLGLSLGNTVTLVAGLLLQWDVQSTKQSLRDLDSAKYNHKAL